MTFDSLRLHEPILRAVLAEGYTTPTPIQAQAIPHLLEGRDLLGCAQTGTGKTAAFALPILHRLTHAGNPPRGQGRRIRVLVLSPTRELAQQIADSFQTYGRHTHLRHTVVYGGVSQHPQTKALKNGVDILIATPGRLLDLMQQGYVDLRSIETFVLDEADRMLDMGFMPDIRRITAKLPKDRQTVMFSATMPEPIMELANDLLRDAIDVRIAPVKATTELIDQSVCHVSKQDKTRLLAELINGRGIARAIVFTRTKHGADRVAKQLCKLAIRADAIHGDKSQNARQRVLNNFKTNRVQVLVATDVAARGIDVDGISHVFNYDLPHEPETYVHRIGRTGRAGASGAAVSFCDHDERRFLRAIEQLIRKALVVEQNLPEGIVALPVNKPRRDEALAGRGAPSRGKRFGKGKTGAYAGNHNGQTAGKGGANQQGYGGYAGGKGKPKSKWAGKKKSRTYSPSR